MKPLLVLLLILCCTYQHTYAQSDTLQTDSTTLKKTKRGSLVGLPVVFYTPETSWAFGAAGIYAFRFPDSSDSSRISQVQLSIAYTLNKQILVFAPFRLFLKEHEYSIYGELGYYIYSYWFYGVGNDQPTGFEELYEVTFPRVRLNALKRVAPSIYLGGRYIFDSFQIKQVEEDQQLVEGTITGSPDGGVVSGLGLVANYDTRNFINSPTKGAFVEGVALLNSPVFGSDYTFTRYLINGTKYFPLGKKKRQVLALNAYGEFISGDPPFFQMAFFGGRSRARGYYEGRFRDKNMVILQAEYRTPLFWRIGAVVFGSYGGVAPQIDRFDIADFRYNYGAGFRFLLDEEERINVRVDFGFGKDTFGFYFTFNEAF